MIRPVAISLIELFAIIFSFGQSDITARDSMRVNEIFLNRPMLEVIEVFEDKYNCLIAYEAHDIADLFVHRYLNDLSIDDALRDVLENSGLEFQFIQDNEILIRKSKAANEGADLTIEGRIVSADTQLPLAWATIYDSASRRTAYTDQQGRFKLRLLDAPPSGLLKVKYMGYSDQTVVWSHKEHSLFVTMKNQPYELSEVVITQRLPLIQTTTFSSGHRRKRYMKNVPLASPGVKDLLRELQLLPGISATSDLSAGLSVRGGDENESLYLLDGIEFFNIDHFFGIFSAFDANTIDSTNVYLSDFPLKYGGRTSGVVDMRLKQPAGADLNGQLGIHSLYSIFNLETKLTKNSGILISTRFTNGDISDDDIYDVLFSNTETPRNIENGRRSLNEVVPFFRFNDSQLKWQWRPGERSSISATLYRARDESDTDYRLRYPGMINNQSGLFTEKYNESLEWDNTGLNLSYDQSVSEDWNFELDLSATEYSMRQNILTSLKFENRVFSDSIKLMNDLNNTVAGVALKWANEFTVFEDHEVIAGFDLESHRTDLIVITEDTIPVDRRDTAVNISIFGGYTFPVSSDIDLSFGVRLNSYSPTGQTYLSPRASITYKAGENWLFDISGGVYNQFLRTITYVDRFGKSHDLWGLADNGIRVLKSFHSNISVQYSLDRFLFNLEFYRKRTSNELIQMWSVNGFNDTNKPMARNSRIFNGSGKYTGINTYFRYQAERYNATLAYTLSKNTISVPVIDNGEPFPASNDRRHELSLVNAFNFGNWTIGNALVYGSGYPFVSSLEIKNRDIRNLEVEERIERLPDYFRVDLAVDYNFKLWGQDFHAGISIYNLLDRKNSDQVQYLYNLEPQRTGDDDYIVGSEINLLPRTLDISLEWHF